MTKTEEQKLARKRRKAAAREREREGIEETNEVNDAHVSLPNNPTGMQAMQTARAAVMQAQAGGSGDTNPPLAAAANMGLTPFEQATADLHTVGPDGRQLAPPELYHFVVHVVGQGDGARCSNVMHLLPRYFHKPRLVTLRLVSQLDFTGW